MEANAVASRLRERLTPVPEGIAAVYLFGSAATGEMTPASDVDVAVLYEETPPATLDGLGLRLAAELETALGRTVDLIVLNRAPTDLVHRVLRDGLLVAEANRTRRVQFEVKARNEYFDLAPTRRRYRHAGGRV